MTLEELETLRRLVEEDTKSQVGPNVTVSASLKEDGGPEFLVNLGPEETVKYKELFLL